MNEREKKRKEKPYSSELCTGIAKSVVVHQPRPIYCISLIALLLVKRKNHCRILNINISIALFDCKQQQHPQKAGRMSDG